MTKGIGMVIIIGVLLAGITLFAFLMMKTRDESAEADPDTNAPQGETSTLSMKYIAIHEPPLIETSIAQFLCAAPLVEVNGRQYCIGSETGAAAGSAYTTYTYNTMKNDRLVTVRFTLRYPQCANYDEPQKSECEQEQKTFDVNAFADNIVSNTQVP